MNRPVNWDAAERIEQIYAKAEIKARARQDVSDEVGSDWKKLACAPAPDLRLVSVAKRELERRAFRTRYLPPELSGDTGWAILLDLFINESQPCSASAYHNGGRWNLSPATFSRLIAALIEEGLLVRILGQHNEKAFARFRLSHFGQEQVSKVLQHFGSPDEAAE